MQSSGEHEDVLSATLDTSCAQHFLSIEEPTDEALVEVIAAAFAGRLSVAVSQEAFDEVGRTPDRELRERRLARLRAFGCVTLPASRTPERDTLAAALHSSLFPAATAGSRTDEHNWRDCRQMATHHLIGRERFVTRDGDLLKRGELAATHGVQVTSPSVLRDHLKEEARRRGLESIPSISVRDAVLPADEADIRAVLAPLADDYPGFDAWLTGRLAQPAKTRIRLGEFNGHVRAVALSGQKDARVMKLSAFYVAEDGRASGLGAHLLWSELRTWVRNGFEKAYVTVSSRHADLIEFFTGFGFVVEGVSPRRYQDDTAEFVLAKHLIRERITDDDLPRFADAVANVVFAVPQDADVPDTGWSLQPAAERLTFTWEGEAPQLHLVASAGERALRRWSLFDLERIFYPARFALADRKALLVPIERRWADALVEYQQQQGSLLTGGSEKLLLRADNAYYAFPKAVGTATPGTPILFYVMEPVGALIGEARIFEAVVDEPEELFLRFGGLGIYELANIRPHVQQRGTNAGKALALRFGLYAPFEQPVSRKRMFELLGRRLVPQGLTPVDFKEFEELRRTGGLTW